MSMPSTWASAPSVGAVEAPVHSPILEGLALCVLLLDEPRQACGTA